MKREDHICYCQVCTHRKFEQLNGLICGLTNKVADFVDTCENFDLDMIEKMTVNEKYQKEIEESIERQKTFLKRIADGEPRLFFLTKKGKDEIIYKDFDEVIVKESKSKKAHFLGLSILMVGLGIYSIYNNYIDVKDAGQIIASIAVFIGLPGGLLYSYFKDSELFRMSSKGLIIGQQNFVPWFKIRFIHFEIVRQKNKDATNLFLRMATGDDIRINVAHTNMTEDQLGKCVYNYFKKFKPN